MMIAHPINHLSFIDRPALAPTPMQASILSHSQDMSMSFFQHVSCGHDQEGGEIQGENSILEETKTVIQETKTAMEETNTGIKETKNAMEETKSVMDSLDFDMEDSKIS